jgi:hypothetical protein
MIIPNLATSFFEKKDYIASLNEPSKFFIGKEGRRITLRTHGDILSHAFMISVLIQPQLNKGWFKISQELNKDEALTPPI